MKVLLAFTLVFGFMGQASASCEFTTQGPLKDYDGAHYSLSVKQPGGNGLTIRIPAQLVPLKKGLDVQYKEGVCNKTTLKYDGRTLYYRTTTTCDFPEGASASVTVAPDLSQVSSASGHRTVYLIPIPIPKFYDRFSCR